MSASLEFLTWETSQPLTTIQRMVPSKPPSGAQRMVDHSSGRKRGLPGMYGGSPLRQAFGLGIDRKPAGAVQKRRWCRVDRENVLDARCIGRRRHRAVISEHHGKIVVGDPFAVVTDELPAEHQALTGRQGKLKVGAGAFHAVGSPGAAVIVEMEIAPVDRRLIGQAGRRRPGGRCWPSTAVIPDEAVVVENDERVAVARLDENAVPDIPLGNDTANP